MTRTVCFGAPSDEIRRVYAAVNAAQLAGIGALRAGASGESVDRAARKVIEDAGHGDAFTHRLGHGLGVRRRDQQHVVVAAYVADHGVQVATTPFTSTDRVLMALARPPSATVPVVV